MSIAAPRNIVIAIAAAVEQQAVAGHGSSRQDALDDARDLIACWERIHGHANPPNPGCSDTAQATQTDDPEKPQHHRAERGTCPDRADLTERTRGIPPSSRRAGSRARGQR